MGFVVGVVDETAEADPKGTREVLKNSERSDFFAFVGRERDAVTQKKQGARWGQRGTNVRESSL